MADPKCFMHPVRCKGPLWPCAVALNFYPQGADHFGRPNVLYAPDCGAARCKGPMLALRRCAKLLPTRGRPLWPTQTALCTGLGSRTMQRTPLALCRCAKLAPTRGRPLWPTPSAFCTGLGSRTLRPRPSRLASFTVSARTTSSRPRPSSTNCPGRPVSMTSTSLATMPCSSMSCYAISLSTTA